MSQHHFVVKFDIETRKWSWDTDTESAVFNDGTILLGDEWVKSGNIIDTHPNVYNLDEVCSTVLASALDIMNTSLKRNETEHLFFDKKQVTEMDGVS